MPKLGAFRSWVSVMRFQQSRGERRRAVLDHIKTKLFGIIEHNTWLSSNDNRKKSAFLRWHMNTLSVHLTSLSIRRLNRFMAFSVEEISVARIGQTQDALIAAIHDLIPDLIQGSIGKLTIMHIVMFQIIAQAPLCLPYLQNLLFYPLAPQCCSNAFCCKQR